MIYFTSCFDGDRAGLSLSSSDYPAPISYDPADMLSTFYCSSASFFFFLRSFSSFFTLSITYQPNSLEAIDLNKSYWQFRKFMHNFDFKAYRPSNSNAGHQGPDSSSSFSFSTLIFFFGFSPSPVIFGRDAFISPVSSLLNLNVPYF